MKEIESAAAFEEAIQEGTVVAQFYADWCPDCKFTEPFMPEVERQYDQQLQIVHVNRDDLPELAEQYGIFGIPSFVAFYGGSETIRLVNRLRKTRREIEQFLDRVAEVSHSLSNQSHTK